MSDKEIKGKIVNIENALKDREFYLYSHTVSPDEYKNNLLAIVDDNDEIENLIFDLGLTVYMEFAVKRGLKEDVEYILKDLIESTKELTNNDVDAVGEYENLLDKVKEFL